ncbi:MAG TPA: hypothetical protein VM284_06515 [Candidatus Limnocylindria bacterium]|nr:hypothetical protein [Candidatus Limnocylindria bacterium]
MSDYSVSQFSSRDSAGPVTCAACGCRLDALTGKDDGVYRHFMSMALGQDARGCRVECVAELHDHDGRAIAEAAAA